MSFNFEAGALRAYRASMSSVVPLDREKERVLARRWRDGDRKAGVAIIEACLPFVITIALEYRRWGVPLEDIIQQGNMGLLRAAAKFDLGKDCRLATYAAYWIRAEIREYVVRSYRVVRLGTTKSERRALRAYRRTQESNPAILAAESGISEARAAELIPILAARESTLDGRGVDGSSLLDRMASPEPSPEAEVEAHEIQDKIGTALSHAMQDLTDRERLIVRERLMNDEPKTLQELGAVLGVSKERVRQLEERARGKLRETLAAFRDLAAA